MDAGVGRERIGDVDFGVVAGFVAYERGGLQGTLERAGDDAIELHVERAEKSADQ